MERFELARRTLLLSVPGLLTACASGAAIRSATLPQAAFDPLPDFPKAPLSPALPRSPLANIAISSCSNEDRPAPLYNDILVAKPDLLLMVGDNVYGSAKPEDPELSDLRAAYTTMARHPEFTNLVSQIPNLAVWDDHDFGKNDAGGDFAYKGLAQRMFNSFWNIAADSPLRAREGLYRQVQIGPKGQRVQIIILDTRYFRDPLRPTDQRNSPGRERYIPHPLESNADILGAAQWAWLEATLKEPADVRIVVSSIQVVADGHGWERWSQFPVAQSRLYRLIETSGAKGVVFVSGDRHLGAINKYVPVSSYPLFDLTASAINTSSWQEGRPTDNGEAGSFRLGASYTPPNYGMVRVDWSARTLVLETIGAGNKPVNNARIAFKDLGLT
jgi:alkaline phosphatase D